MSHRAGWPVLLALAAGCGDDRPACPADEVRRDGTVRPLCASAWEFARRSTDALAPSQDEVDAALDLVMTSGQPLYATLGHLPTAGPWFGLPTELGGEVTHPALVAAWTSATVETGVAEVDAVLAAIGATTAAIHSDRFFFIRTHRAIATRNVERALAGVPGLVIAYDDLSTNTFAHDIADEGLDPSDGGHLVRFQIGWFNCPLGCTYLHHWRTKVQPDGSVILVEEWGDPIPPDILAAWSAPEP